MFQRRRSSLRDASIGFVEVRVDTSCCMLSGFCSAIAPTIFEADPELKHVRVLTPVVDDPELQELVRDARDACPTGAISLSEE